ncbi:MAG: histidine phosphatase family protein [Oscillospiraceae bacterium]
MINYKIHFIACGKAENSEKYLYMGQEDYSLTKKGEDELLLLKENFMYPDVQMVYSSPLQRCIKTAEIIYPERFIAIDENLKEFNMGVLQKKSLKQLEKNTHFKNFIEKGLSYAIPGGESGEDFSLRCIGAVKNIFTNMMKDKINSVAVVTHPGIIMYIISAMGIPKVDFKKNLIGPGTGFTLFASPQLWMQSGALEVYSHLPYELEKQQEENN